MSKIIRIGTRDSELALWQANTVREKLELYGYQTTLVPVKSTGDLQLDKPLYELGVTGIFTKTLDIAMLKGEIDIAVHSMKDVPTALPTGIVKAAVLERANHLDILAYKNNEEFLAQPNAIIATGSLRRKAQWLNRYPTHTVVDLRGNINSRYEKLVNNNWDAAIFAAAGLNRIDLQPKNTIGLTWMVPAPAQGAIMVVANEKDTFTREACAELNHEPTEICTHLEREFLRILEGGCTAPIGALATIDENTVTLKGILLTTDGKKKLEAEFSAPLGKHQFLGRDCANSILSRGGKLLMNEIQGVTLKTHIFSTKDLTPNQRQHFKAGIRIKSHDFIKISPNRIPASVLNKKIDNVILTSKNAVEALLTHRAGDDLRFNTIYCVGRKTKRFIESRIGPVRHQEKNAKKLAEYLVEHMEGTEVTYFCSNLRMDDLPNILAENGIKVNEIEAYTTKPAGLAISDHVEGVLFFSPSTVQSYLHHNRPDKVAYCIGETTAKEARKTFKDVRVAKIPTVESVIELVNEHYGS